MQLYEYAVIRISKDGNLFSDPMVPITAIVARDEEHVRKIAARAIPGLGPLVPEERNAVLEEAQILIRPFC